MIRRSAWLYMLAACSLFFDQSACQVSRTTSRFVPHLYSIRVLPPAGGGDLTVEQGGSVIVQVEVTMGVNVSGEFIQTRLAESTLPSGVSLDPNQLFFIDLPDLAAEQSSTVSYTLLASPTAGPGRYQVTINSNADITVEDADDSDTREESVTFTLIVTAPGSNVPDTGDGDGGSTGPTSGCQQFVDHYNSLPCITELLMADNTCSPTISEFCQDGSAFNACRIENTFCEGDELIQNLDDCFALCN